MKNNQQSLNRFTRRIFIRKGLGLCVFMISMGSVIARPLNVLEVAGKMAQFFRPMNNQSSGENHNNHYKPRYLTLYHSGELRRRGEILWQMMDVCRLCPPECETKRLDGQKGDCGATSQLEVSSFHPHFGEEEPLVGKGGSGTIFMTHCSLRCVYCINWQISMGGEGNPRSIEQLSQMMLRLQSMGCQNINIVTPTHYVPHMVLALDKAAAAGLHIPLVYNTSGYEKIETLRLLDGVVDVYLPDFKYYDDRMADKYSSGASDYPERVKTALKEMHRQVGVARPSDDGLMYRGLMIRHLVLPNGISHTGKVASWVAQNLSRDTYFHLMAQYTPSYKANRYRELNRRITREEYRHAIEVARQAGLNNLYIQ
jgi:putative pyruvate formate lyase activating enzyme